MIVWADPVALVLHQYPPPAYRGQVFRSVETRTLTAFFHLQPVRRLQQWPSHAPKRIEHRKVVGHAGCLWLWLCSCPVGSHLYSYMRFRERKVVHPQVDIFLRLHLSDAARHSASHLSSSSQPWLVYLVHAAARAHACQLGLKSASALQQPFRPRLNASACSAAFVAFSMKSHKISFSGRFRVPLDQS